MVEPVKLTTVEALRDEERIAMIQGGIDVIQTLIDEGKVDGFVAIALLKDGSNWTHIAPITDNLKMVGAIEAIKAEALKIYLEAGC